LVADYRVSADGCRFLILENKDVVYCLWLLCVVHVSIVKYQLLITDAQLCKWHKIKMMWRQQLIRTVYNYILCDIKEKEGNIAAAATEGGKLSQQIRKKVGRE
jgi:hypothetical protein